MLSPDDTKRIRILNCQTFFSSESTGFPILKSYQSRVQVAFSRWWIYHLHQFNFIRTIYNRAFEFNNETVVQWKTIYFRQKSPNFSVGPGTSGLIEI